MKKHTGNSKKLSENNYILSIYTFIDNFNLYIKIIYLSRLISVIISICLNYIVYISMLISLSISILLIIIS